ncbi:MAG TPA: hypothetical protein VK395_36810 [Gemmataceae bacterium]|nr:hypothetical protein [Gemmataceae bacterium]
MGWARKVLPAKGAASIPILVGIDVDATRARAVHGPGRQTPRPLPLDDPREDLPMVLSLEGRRPELGRAGASLCRRSPHLACSSFWAYLGEPREWTAGRHRLDASKASAVVLEHLQSACAPAQGVVLALPAYLTRAQVALLGPLAKKVRLPLLGSVRAPLASALAAYTAEPWSGMALVIDVDDHVLTATTVVADGEQLSAHASQAWPHLSLRAWKGRLLDMIAERCIRQSRRDPRDSAVTEQSLYEQLEDALDTAARAKMVELLVQTTHWYQNLFLRPEEIVSFCERPVRQVVEGIQTMMATSSARDGLCAVLVTRAVERLPGLFPALQDYVREHVQAAAEPDPSDDFGEDLLQGAGGPARVMVIPADGVARAAHHLADRFQRGELPRGHLDLSVPLPKSDPSLPDHPSSKRGFRILSADTDPE